MEFLGRRGLSDPLEVVVSCYRGHPALRPSQDISNPQKNNQDATVENPRKTENRSYRGNNHVLYILRTIIKGEGDIGMLPLPS